MTDAGAFAAYIASVGDLYEPQVRNWIAWPDVVHQCSHALQRSSAARWRLRHLVDVRPRSCVGNAQAASPRHWELEFHHQAVVIRTDDTVTTETSDRIAVVLGVPSHLSVDGCDEIAIARAPQDRDHGWHDHASGS